MAKYILKRLIQSFFTVFGVMIITFLLFNIVAGDPSGAYMSPKATRQDRLDWLKNRNIDLPSVLNRHTRLQFIDQTTGSEEYKIEDGGGYTLNSAADFQVIYQNDQTLPPGERLAKRSIQTKRLADWCSTMPAGRDTKLDRFLKNSREKVLFRSKKYLEKIKNLETNPGLVKAQQEEAIEQATKEARKEGTQKYKLKKLRHAKSAIAWVDNNNLKKKAAVHAEKIFEKVLAEQKKAGKTEAEARKIANVSKTDAFLDMQSKLTDKNQYAQIAIKDKAKADEKAAEKAREAAAVKAGLAAWKKAVAGVKQAGKRTPPELKSEESAYKCKAYITAHNAKLKELTEAADKAKKEAEAKQNAEMLAKGDQIDIAREKAREIAEQYTKAQTAKLNAEMPAIVNATTAEQIKKAREVEAKREDRLEAIEDEADELYVAKYYEIVKTVKLKDGKKLLAKLEADAKAEGEKEANKAREDKILFFKEKRDEPGLAFQFQNGQKMYVSCVGVSNWGQLIDKINNHPANRQKKNPEKKLIVAQISKWQAGNLKYSQLYYHMKNCITFEGKSFQFSKTLQQIISERAKYSLSLTVPSLAVGWFVALGLSCIVAYYRGTWIDHTAIFICVIGMCIPFLAYMIVGQSMMFKIAPEMAYGVHNPANVYIPIGIAMIAGLGRSVRFYRTVILNEVNQDYVRTARAKGVALPGILFKHVLKNCMLPVITSVVMTIPFLIMGNLLLEKFFGIPGLGDLMLGSISSRDVPIITAMTFLTAVVYVVGLLVTDILYAVFDPRIRLR